MNNLKNKLRKYLINNGNIFFSLIGKVGFVMIGNILTIISLPIITRALGPKAYGIYTLSINIAGYFFLPANWGFLAKGIREVAKLPENSITILKNLVSARFILSLTGAMIAIICSAFFMIETSLMTAIIFALGINVCTSLIPDFYYYGLKKSLLPSVSLLIGQLFFFVSVIIINQKSVLSINNLIILQILAKALEGLIQYLPILKNIKFNRRDFYFSKALLLFKDNFIIGLGAKAGFIFSTLPVLLISYFMDDLILGLFSASFKIFLVISMLFQSMNLVFSPWIVDYKIKNKESKLIVLRKISLLYIFSSILISVLLFFFSEQIVNLLFGYKFNKASDFLKIISVFLIPLWAIYILFTMFLNNLELDKIYFIGILILLGTLILFSPIGLVYLGIRGLIFGMFLSLLVTVSYYFAKLKILSK